MKKVSVVEKHFDKIALEYDHYKQNSAFYYKNLKTLISNLIPKNSNVLEIGCGTGDILASLKPKHGFGMDISEEMIGLAKKKYSANKKLIFSTKYPKVKYDYIFMTDVIEHLENYNLVFSKIIKLMHHKSFFINTMANPLWEPILMVWEWLGWKMPEGKHYRISYKKLKSILENLGFKVIEHNYKLLFPIELPIITKFANRYLEKYLRRFAFIEYFVAIKS